ncbi:MAG: L-type lectin-domain containing protein, partial [Bacteroidota bacterium]
MLRFSFKPKTPLFFCLLLGLASLGHAQYNTVGNATANGPDCFILTNNATSQTGAAWNTTTIDPNFPFDIRGSINLGTNDGGADGIAFVLQTAGSGAIGGLGGSLGYGGLIPSLIIEFDTYQNSTWGDPVFDHVAILSAGSNSHIAATSLVAPVGILPGNANAEDGLFHDVRFRWLPAISVFEVYVDCQLRLTYNGDIRTVLNNSTAVTYGFTASTGGLTNQHQACFDPSPTSPGARTNLSLCLGDTLDLMAPVGTGYNWNPAAGLSATNQQNVRAFPTTSTQYLVSYQD